ncbi:unnamed protein product [Closterium sp. NIES-54]
MKSTYGDSCSSEEERVWRGYSEEEREWRGATGDERVWRARIGLTEKEATRTSSLLLASAQHSRGHEEPNVRVLCACSQHGDTPAFTNTTPSLAFSSTSSSSLSPALPLPSSLPLPLLLLPSLLLAQFTFLRGSLVPAPLPSLLVAFALVAFASARCAALSARQ